MDSNSSSEKRTALLPQREGGRQRVEALLKAASDLIAERGYEATTMADIAARADTRIGSLYRFFPGKDAIADTLLQRHIKVLGDECGALEKRAENITPEDLADLLLTLLVTLYPRIRSLPTLLSARTDRTEIRDRSRALALDGIAGALRVCAPRLDQETARNIAAVILNNMKTMLGMTLGEVPATPGAPDELQRMNRLYLSSRLTPYRDPPPAPGKPGPEKKNPRPEQQPA
ncbi:TetR/AcrR family transcriptional regulator [Acetobacter oeni]|uniref:HTH tetR-type domain-containing protein n=1 Tax=Acetobacter oeni TaxID=304077 RepID=A0A511XH87_9PROT|nr:TetR/AcrR family transcriptional regulator [Acetobacter oeni]MBB3882462.1 AcrR family transcriptional regulator [Acetobacter oeni]NHO18445.1 TetR family transcriptional regulator [Acetobacter oeni]GBR03281.1 transcriptional regulator [Acetobacter oeni LMG 21952]GEN62316.1 hypothetical protein AOE01nite_05400 [Acetobacter oeni]